MTQSRFQRSHIGHCNEWELEYVLRPDCFQLKHSLVEWRLQNLRVTELIHLGKQGRWVQPITVTRSRATCPTRSLFSRGTWYPLHCESADLQLRVVQLLFSTSTVDYIPHVWNRQRCLSDVSGHDNYSSVFIFHFLEDTVLLLRW